MDPIELAADILRVAFQVYELEREVHESDKKRYEGSFARRNDAGDLFAAAARVAYNAGVTYTLTEYDGRKAIILLRKVAP